MQKLDIRAQIKEKMEEVKSTKLLEPGTYRFEISDAAIERMEATGEKVLTLELAINGVKLLDFNTIDNFRSDENRDRSVIKLAALAKCIGIAIDDAFDEKGNPIPAIFIGKTGEVELSLKVSKGVRRNRVAYYVIQETLE